MTAAVINLLMYLDLDNDGREQSKTSFRFNVGHHFILKCFRKPYLIRNFSMCYVYYGKRKLALEEQLQLSRELCLPTRLKINAAISQPLAFTYLVV